MTFQAGNRFWEARSSHGRKPIFDSPEKLWDAATQYFEWNENNPLWEVKSYMYQGAPVQDQIPKMRAMTIEGLCLFLDISKQAWSEYKQRDGFGDVTREIDDIIRKQKFEGAAAEMLNANIIARDLGLREQTESRATISLTDLSEDELDRRLAQLEQTAKD